MEIPQQPSLLVHNVTSQNPSQVSFLLYTMVIGGNNPFQKGYSIITYILQIKDRHNGNILLDREGHLIHIDFGFMLSNSPGNIGFEAAPFKLPPEYVEVLGGISGEAFLEFRRLFREGFEVARKHCDRIISKLSARSEFGVLTCETLHSSSRIDAERYLVSDQ